MSKILIDRSTVEQVLEALEAGPDVDPIFAGETADALRAALAEPVQEPDSPERRCGGPGCDMTCCQPVQEPATLPGPGLVMCPACCAQFDPALNSVQPVQEPKPVAWMTVRLNVPIQTTARKDVADEWLKWGEVLPLYTAPQQRPAKPQGCDHCNHPLYAAIKCRVCGRVTEPTPPQRKPLSEDEKRALADKFLSCQPESYEVSGVFDLISAVERAHGIGGEE